MHMYEWRSCQSFQLHPPWLDSFANLWCFGAVSAYIALKKQTVSFCSKVVYLVFPFLPSESGSCEHRWWLILPLFASCRTDTMRSFRGERLAAPILRSRSCKSYADSNIRWKVCARQYWDCPYRLGKSVEWVCLLAWVCPSLAFIAPYTLLRKSPLI